MMLTLATAQQMNIDDREDPEQSIMAGTGYLDYLRNALPERIQEPDKTWLALAAYNVGLGHLEDARILTQRSGKNPDVWLDVKAHLPLLAKKKYYETTRYGYARGGEPVRYIENVRRYYDILLYELENKIETESVIELTPIITTPPAAL
jgi:membrane-bound lytic murein transglycosylase F